jgi:hypothetical protein
MGDLRSSHHAREQDMPEERILPDRPAPFGESGLTIFERRTQLTGTLWEKLQMNLRVW